MEYFAHYGGDIETWVLNKKIVHAKRVFGKDHILHKKVTKEDLINGYDRFIKSRSKPEEENNDPPPHMYT